jgi:hypothetical protein
MQLHLHHRLVLAFSQPVDFLVVLQVVLFQVLARSLVLIHRLRNLNYSKSHTFSSYSSSSFLVSLYLWCFFIFWSIMNSWLPSSMKILSISSSSFCLLSFSFLLKTFSSWSLTELSCFTCDFYSLRIYLISLERFRKVYKLT